MNRQDLEQRTKEFALEIIRLLSNLPKTKSFYRRGRGGNQEEKVLSSLLSVVRPFVASERVSDVKDPPPSL
jgi:hypothetical protein